VRATTVGYYEAASTSSSSSWSKYVVVCLFGYLCKSLRLESESDSESSSFRSTANNFYFGTKILCRSGNKKKAEEDSSNANEEYICVTTYNITDATEGLLAVVIRVITGLVLMKDIWRRNLDMM
jgi:hypothetical protein